MTDRLSPKRIIAKRFLFKKRFIYKRRFLAIICFTILFGYLVAKVIVSALNNFDSLIKELQGKKNLKSVQLITGRFGWKNWGMGDELGEAPFQSCREKRCYAFRTLLSQQPDESSDGVMVHIPNLWYMPPRKTYKRNNRQLWLFYSMESPGLSYCSMHYNLNELDDWFNITVTFKSDSDFVADYKPFKSLDDIINDKLYFNAFRDYISNISHNPKYNVLNLALKTESFKKIAKYNKNLAYAKKAEIVWFVSHCETNSRRENYVTELMKYINVDIYGNCDNYFNTTLKHPCGELKAKNADHCNDNLLNSYKFYLAFENSLCYDYISEKYYKLFKPSTLFNSNIVPIVRGAQQEQYKKIAPQFSFIDTTNYKTPKQLADYLNYLISNKTAYLEYFKWKLNVFDKFLSKDIEERQIFDDEQNNPNEDTSYFNYNENYQSRIDKMQVPFCAMCNLLHNETYMSSKTNRKWIISDWFNKQTNCWDQNEKRVYVYWIAQFFGFCF